MRRKSKPRTAKSPARKAGAKPKGRVKGTPPKKKANKTKGKKTVTAERKSQKVPAAKTALLDRIELFPVPSNGTMDRVVVAKMGELTYPDTLDIYKARDRERFRLGLSKEFGIPVEDLVGLDQRLQQKAAEVDADANAQADKLNQSESAGGGRPSQATQLVELADGFELFHTPDGEAYGTIPVQNHHETYLLRSKGFRRWLCRLFFESYGKSPGSQALQDALGVLEGKALYDGEEHEVHLRLAEHNGCIYLDLANSEWEAVKVSKGGWCVVPEPPVKFRRARGMLRLPHPEKGGTLAALQPFVNIDKCDWPLFVGALVGDLQPRGPYPITVLHGEQGSAKSTAARVRRSLIDPNKAALRSQPREERDLAIAANNSWFVMLDNISFIPQWLSDALCRLATGGGFATRELYTDTDEAIFDFKRPAILNGIEELATRGDLLDRSVLFYLPWIPKKKRRTEEKFWAAFNEAHPKLLGSLLDATSTALCNLPNVKLAELPRMADFATWVVAAEPALGIPPGSFMKAYNENRADADALAMEGSLVVVRLRTLAEQIAAVQKPWGGTASELLARLEERMDEAERRKKTWPANGQVLSNKLRGLAPNLRRIGIAIKFERETGSDRTRKITIRTLKHFRVRRVRRDSLIPDERDEEN